MLASAATFPVVVSSCGSSSEAGTEEPASVASVKPQTTKKTTASPTKVTSATQKKATESTVNKTYPKKINPTVSIPARSAKGVSHYRGSASLPYVALTFDDGPHPTHTPRLLNILRSHNVKATFYVTGQNAARYPSLIQRIVSEGHEIGNHTWSHPNLTKLSDSAVKSQLDRSNTAIKKGLERQKFKLSHFTFGFWC